MRGERGEERRGGIYGKDIRTKDNAAKKKKSRGTRREAVYFHDFIALVNI